MTGKKEKKGRTSCCDKNGVKKGLWTSEEDKLLVDYINENGLTNTTWRSIPQLAGLRRCGKSCRLRWNNYLRPDIKRGNFTTEEEQQIIKLQATLGNKWAAIASNLPGRTDNEIKNLWNTHLKKRVSSTDLSIITSAAPSMNQSACMAPSCIPYIPQSSSTLHMANWESVKTQADTNQSMDSLLLNPSLTVKTECNYYLQLWNSEVGESFRKIEKVDRVESGSGITMLEGPADASDEQSSNAHINSNKAYSDHSNSFQMEPPSDSALDLLLDFPSGGDYLEFFNQDTGDFSSFPQE